ncbi:MAG TPA: ribonuclease R [Candidatus Coproplasma stercoravium]|nr:ribonuclease R [Candidatus Coproplasma stercoravium]
MTVRENIEELFARGKLAFKTEKQVCEILKIKPTEKKAVKHILEELEKDGVILKNNSGEYCSPAQIGAVSGTISGNERGFAFLIPDGKTADMKDYFIPRHSLKGALDGDRVLAAKVKGTEDEATVIKILSRGRTAVAGTFERVGGACYVVPDSAKFVPRIFVPTSLSLGAKQGDKVVCRITAYPHGKAPNGKVTEILGKSGDFFAEELSIIRNYGLYEEFPKEVEKQAESVAAEKVVLGKRRDLRGELTITIDGDDTRDIDDAVSLKRRGGNFVLGVHIADVGHYVKRGSKLDGEAYNRGTSVYFPDRVLPMLPRALSNGACSLNEGEDRYALSCVMTITPEGKRIKSEIFESVINSNHRTTYKEITALIEGDEGAAEKYPDLITMCRDMKELCEALSSRRERLGNIDLSVKEAHISLDERGEIVIPDFERTISEKIIEQFMISANEAVAERMEKAGAPFMFRVHEPPAPEKIASFLSFLSDLGISGKVSEDEPTPKQFQAILKRVAGKPCEGAVNKVMLRTMQKARYFERNLGHFGIASGCYCHFTSPIRRYPDLFIHRIIKGMLHGELDLMREKYAPVAAEEAAHCSLCERNADGAERDVDSLYKVVYMSDRTGEEYEATVSGVTAFGVFAELDNTVEGLIRLEKLPGGSYEYLEDKFVLKGERTFRLGDRIKIRVDGCDWGNMRPEFSLADMPAESGKNTQKSDEPKRERKPGKKQSTVQSVHKKGSSSAHKKGTPYAHKKGADKNTKKFVKSRQSRGKRR